MGRKSRGNRRVSPVCVVSYLALRHADLLGDRGFLAHVQETTQETPSPGPIAVVSEFQDVFPEDLPGMPPQRETEFAIE